MGNFNLFSKPHFFIPIRDVSGEPGQPRRPGTSSADRSTFRCLYDKFASFGGSCFRKLQRRHTVGDTSVWKGAIICCAGITLRAIRWRWASSLTHTSREDGEVHKTGHIYFHPLNVLCRVGLFSSIIIIIMRIVLIMVIIKSWFSSKIFQKNIQLNQSRKIYLERCWRENLTLNSFNHNINILSR